MTITSSEKSQLITAIQIKTQKLFLAVLLKERVRLSMMLTYFLIQSLGIYLLSTNVLERTSTQLYSNSTIVLYFRIVVLLNPVIVGLLFGVPLLSSEYESGTYRFLFMHGVGRRRLVRAHLLVYSLSILLFSVMTFISIDHFFAVQTAAGPISIWSFAVFVCQPMIIIALTLVLFIAGVFLGILTRNTVLGIATTILFSILLILGMQALLEKAIFLFVQKLKNYIGNPTDAYNNFVGSFDSKYMLQFQLGCVCLLTILALLLGYGSLQATRNGGIIYRKLKQLNGERANI